jgi:hypothetical protein
MMGHIIIKWYTFIVKIIHVSYMLPIDDMANRGESSSKNNGFISTSSEKWY